MIQKSFPVGNSLEAKAASFFQSGRVFFETQSFLKWQGFLKASGDNLQMTIPQAKSVGKLHTFLQSAGYF